MLLSLKRARPHSANSRLYLPALDVRTRAASRLSLVQYLYSIESNLGVMSDIKLHPSTCLSTIRRLYLLLARRYFPLVVRSCQSVDHDLGSSPLGLFIPTHIRPVLSRKIAFNIPGVSCIPPKRRVLRQQTFDMRAERGEIDRR
jgi:hypothetical protein